MSEAVELLLARLDKPRRASRDRWRCACPVCGEANRSTLSIGIGGNGCVLVKCFKNGCGPDEIASAVGIDIADLFPARESSAPPLRRRRLWIVASDMVRGVPLDVATKGRLTVAVGRIGTAREEVGR